MANTDGQRGEYREQTVTILSVTQDRIKKGPNRGRLFEKYEVEGFEGKWFYNFHDHLIGEISRPVRAKLAYFDDPKMPKVQKIVLLNEEPKNPQYDGKLSISDALMARMSNIKSSTRALEYLPGDAQEKFEFYKKLLKENEEYLFQGLIIEEGERAGEQEEPF